MLAFVVVVVVVLLFLNLIWNFVGIVFKIKDKNDFPLLTIYGWYVAHDRKFRKYQKFKKKM